MHFVIDTLYCARYNNEHMIEERRKQNEEAGSHHDGDVHVPFRFFSCAFCR